MHKIKRIIASIALALALATGPAVLITQTGCNTTQRIAVNTLFTVGHGVDAAYKGFNDQIIAGKVSIESMVSVAKAYTKFQAIFNAAVDAVQGNMSVAAPVAVTLAAAELTTAISNSKN